MQGVAAHPDQEEAQEDFYIHALLLLFFASQNRPMVATKYACGPLYYMSVLTKSPLLLHEACM